MMNSNSASSDNNNNTNGNNNSNNGNNSSSSNNKPSKVKQTPNVAVAKQPQQQQQQQQQSTQNKKLSQQKKQQNNKRIAVNNSSSNNDNNSEKNQSTTKTTTTLKTNKSNNSNIKTQEKSSTTTTTTSNNTSGNNNNYKKLQQAPRNSLRNSSNTYAQSVGNNNNRTATTTTTTANGQKTQNNNYATKTYVNAKSSIDKKDASNNNNVDATTIKSSQIQEQQQQQQQQQHALVTTTGAPASEIKINAGDILTAALIAPCAKCSPQLNGGVANNPYNSFSIDSNVHSTSSNQSNNNNTTTYSLIGPIVFTGKQYRKSKSYNGGNRGPGGGGGGGTGNKSDNYRHQLYRRSSFDRNFAERNKDFVPIVQPLKPVLSASNIAAVIADVDKLTIIERLGKGRLSYPIMQCGTLEAPDSSYHQQRSHRMDVFQIDDGFHSDGGTETPPPSPSSGSSIASTSDHGSLESVDTGGAQRLAVLSFEQVRKLNDVMDETVAIHGRGNFPTLEVKLKDLVNLVRRKLEADVASGGAGVIVKDIRLNGGAASHVLASEDQPYNDLDLIYAIELSSSRHFDRVKTAVLNTLLDLLPEGVSKRRIMPCALKEAYVGKMVKVNNNNDGDRWSLISLGNSPGHKNVELKFVDTMRRQFEFSVDSFQIVLDSLLLFYDCAALPISENFYPTVVGESVYGDFQEALYHLQKKLISTRQPEEIRGGGLLKYCNLLVRQYKPVDSQRIKTLERYMCSRFFIDFPDINTQTVKLEAYLRNHFWGIEEEPLQYKYLMHLREVVEMSTVCLMGHERRQTLLLIQSLAAQVLYREQHKHHQQAQQAQEQYHQHQQQQQQSSQQQVVDMQQAAQQQHQSVQQAQQQQQQQQIYVQQSHQQQQQQQQTVCCTVTDQQQQQQTSTSIPQTIQIQAGPPGLIYANGVYYAPVIPTTICTCNSTWLST